MKPTPITAQPSVDDLLGRMHEEHERMSALRRGIAHGVPRPTLMVRLLLYTSLVMIAAVTGLIAVTGVRTVHLADAIRRHREEIRVAERALPSGNDLLDETILQRTLVRHPEVAARVHAARGQALAANGEAQAAVAAFAEARLHAVAPLPPTVLAAEIVALVAADRRAEARSRLLATDLSTWQPPERARVVALMPELLLSPADH